MKIRTKIVSGFLTIIILVIVLGITVFFNTVESSNNFTFLVEHDLEVLQNAQKLQKLVVDAETGQRGFVITGDESFLEPYKDGIQGFNSLIRIERELVSDNPSQVERLKNIQILFDEWNLKAAQPEIAAARNYFESTTLGKTTSYSDVALLIQAKTGKNILDQIRNEFSIFIQIENDLKDKRYSDVLTTSTFTETLLILLPISITAVAGILTFVFTQSISRPLEILKQASAKVSSGNLDTKIKQVSLEKRKTKLDNKSNLKPVSEEKQSNFKNKILLVFLSLSFLIGIVGFISYIEITEVRDDLIIITDFSTPALIKLNDMKSVILEGIEEAFAYPLLDKIIEKEEFYEKMNHFDLLAEEFSIIGHIGAADEELETQLFHNIISNKENLVDAASQMFEDYENNGKINLSSVELFEEKIDILVPLIDEFIVIEINEVNKAHLHASQNINAAFLTIPVIILVALLISIFGGILVSRTITEPLVIVSSSDEELQKEYEANPAGDEIKELSESFNKMVSDIKKGRTQIENQLKELTKIDEQKDEFAAMVSHELKTPIVPIQLYTEMLLEGHLGSLEDNQVKALNAIHSNIESLSELVDDVLDVTKLEVGRLTLDKKQVDLKDLISKNIETLKIFAKEKNIILETDLKTSGKIFCDSKRINQVISNLIKNSIDFVPENNGLIKLTVEKDAKSFVFTITDNGSGIPVKNQEFLFQKFYKIDTSPTRKHGGTGLGLTICRGLVESHGGKIWVDKEYTQGSCLKFTIPEVQS